MKGKGGIVTRYQILEHPEEHGQAIDAVAHHREVFTRAPDLVADDRGVHSASAEARLRAAGVKRVAIAAIGKTSAKRQALRLPARLSLPRGHRRAHCETAPRLRS